MKILCACGCGQEREDRNRWGQKRFFISGHWKRNSISKLISKIEKNDEKGCWIFNGKPIQGGYTRTSYLGKEDLSHRIFYELLVEPIEEGKHIHHICETPACVNPEHMRVVSAKEHLVNLSPKNFAYINSRKTHCPKGHELSGDNLDGRMLKRGMRTCEICRKELRKIRDKRARMIKSQDSSGPRPRKIVEQIQD